MCVYFWACHVIFVIALVWRLPFHRRVLAEDNIADLPSRPETGLEMLAASGAQEREPRLADPYLMPEIWESLVEHW